jgi:hypothetical protein
VQLYNLVYFHYADRNYFVDVWQASLEVCPSHLLWEFDDLRPTFVKSSPTPDRRIQCSLHRTFRWRCRRTCQHEIAGVQASLSGCDVTKILTAPSHVAAPYASVNITSAKSALYNDFRTRNTIPTAKLYHGRSNCPVQSTLLATGARLFDPRRGHKPFKDASYWRQRTLCVHDQSPWTRTSHRPWLSSRDAALDQLNVAGFTRFYKTLCKRLCS